MAASDSPQTPPPAAPAAGGADAGARPRLLSSLKGPLIGGPLLLLAFGGLWWNEARVDQTRLLQRARVVDASAVDEGAEGLLVTLSGPLRVPVRQQIGDPLFLRPGDYLLLQRRVEMFAWEETRSGDPARGEEVVYRYAQRWTEQPRPGPSFRYPEGHDNPPLRVHSERFTPPRVDLLAYHFDPDQARLPAPVPLTLRPDLLRSDTPIIEAEPGGGLALPLTYLYRGQTSPLKPQLGDVRIRFEAVSARDAAVVTVFGWQAGAALLPVPLASAASGGSGPFGSFSPAGPAAPAGPPSSADEADQARQAAFAPAGSEVYRPGEDALLRVIPGDPEIARRVLEAEHRGTVWLLRGAGALLLWIGLVLLAGSLRRLGFAAAPPPVRTPRGLRRGLLLALGLLPVAALLALFTILVAVTTRSPGLLVAVLALLFALTRQVLRARSRA